METIQNQPGLIAGLAVGVLLLIGIIVGVWYYRRKRDRKASLHGKCFPYFARGQDVVYVCKQLKLRTSFQ